MITSDEMDGRLRFWEMRDRRITKAMKTGTCEDCADAMSIGGRDSAPDILWELLKGELPRNPQALRRLIPEAWSGAEFPCRCLRINDWIWLFSYVGFISDDGTPKPTKPLTVYRGCGPRHIRGMSWTLDIGMACWFSQRSVYRKPGFVYRATIPQLGVLAILSQQRTGLPEQKGEAETEVVVRPNLLSRVKRLRESEVAQLQGRRGRTLLTRIRRHA
jgi:hypothetical protein